MTLSATGTAHTSESDMSFSLKFDIEIPSKNQRIDALELARNCVNEWNKVLKNKNLL